MLLDVTPTLKQIKAKYKNSLSLKIKAWFSKLF